MQDYADKTNATILEVKEEQKAHNSSAHSLFIYNDGHDIFLQLTCIIYPYSSSSCLGNGQQINAST